MGFRGLFATCLVLLATTPSHAQGPEAGDAFSRGKQLLQEGKVAEACAEFELSMRLDPQNGTLYNLGLCHEQLGKVASAWSEFTQLTEIDKNLARAKDAGKRAATLETKLTRMRIVIASPVAGLVIKRDGIDVTALAGKESPVDPATYMFVASAPAYTSVSLQLSLQTPGATIDVAIPALAPAIADQPQPKVPKAAIVTDPYALRQTLRPIALPKGVYELSAREAWYSSAGYEQDPFDTVVGFTGGLGVIEVHGDVAIHTRYGEKTSTRPTLVRRISAGMDYVFTPLFTAELDLGAQHPLGDDIDTGFDLRSDLRGKRIFTPGVALGGSAGISYALRQTRGDADLARSEFSFVGDGGVQLAPVNRLTLSASVGMQLNVIGDIYDDVVYLRLGAGATVALTRSLDTYVYASFAVVPSTDDGRAVTAGVAVRLP